MTAPGHRDQPLYRAFTKGTFHGEGEPKYGVHWITSRRGWFKVFTDRVQCGDWVIGSSSIKEAVLFKSRQALIPVSVLRLTTDDRTYQFGFNPWARVGRHLPFEFRTEAVKLKYSAISSVIRLLVLAYLIYWFWTKFGPGAN